MTRGTATAQAEGHFITQEAKRGKQTRGIPTADPLEEQHEDKNEKALKEKQEEQRLKYQRAIDVIDSSEEEGRPGSSGLAGGRGLEAPEVDRPPPGQPPQCSQPQTKTSCSGLAGDLGP